MLVAIAAAVARPSRPRLQSPCPDWPPKPFLTWARLVTGSRLLLVLWPEPVADEAHLLNPAHCRCVCSRSPAICICPLLQPRHLFARRGGETWTGAADKGLAARFGVCALACSTLLTDNSPSTHIISASGPSFSPPLAGLHHDHDAVLLETRAWQPPPRT